MAVTRETKEAASSSSSFPQQHQQQQHHTSMDNINMPMSSQRQSRKVKDRGARFNEKHALKYGLSICSRAAKDNSVEMVMCKFCVAFGKESASDSARKRRATANIKYFRQPFRADHYLSHLEINHKLKWALYEHGTVAEKENFFSSSSSLNCAGPMDTDEPGGEGEGGGQEGEVASPLVVAAAEAAAADAHANGLSSEADLHIKNTASDAAAQQRPQQPQQRVGPVRLPVSEIEKDVVEVLIGELFFNSDDEKGVTKEQALQVFVPKAGTPNYEICIKNTRLYDLAVKFISSGASYRLAARLVHCTREETMNAQYGGCSDLRIAGYVRAILASNLQRLAWMMRGAWAYTLATETLHHQQTVYLDVRVRVWYNGALRDFHVFTIPRFDRVPLPVVMERLEKILSILDPRWRFKLLGATCNSGLGRLSTGRNRSLASIQQALAASITASIKHSNFYLIWCVFDHLEAVTKKCVVAFCDKSFYDQLVCVLSKIRAERYRHPSLSPWMPTDLPDLLATFETPRGFVEAFVATLKWLLSERVALTQFFERTSSSGGGVFPNVSSSWWICVATSLRLIAEVEFSMAKMTSMEAAEELGENGGVAMQVHELSKLLQVLQEITGATHRLGRDRTNEDALEEEDPEEEEDAAAMSDAFVLSYVSTEQFIQNEGGQVAVELLDTLRGLERVQTLKCIAQMGVDLITCISTLIHHGRKYCNSDKNTPGVIICPPRVMPYDVYQMGKDKYLKLLFAQENRLRETFSSQEIRRIQNEYYYFVAAIESEPILSGILKKHGVETDLSFAWSCVAGRVVMLQDFIGGLATVVPATATLNNSLQQELRHLNWEKPDYRLTLVDFALEGILHAQQKMQIEVVDVDYGSGGSGGRYGSSGPRNDGDFGGEDVHVAMVIDTTTPVGGGGASGLNHTSQSHQSNSVAMRNEDDAMGRNDGAAGQGDSYATVV